MSFVDAMTSNDMLTENGAVTHSTSGKAIMDMFFQIGGMRGHSGEDVISLFTKALGEDPLTAMKILFYNRDIRGGQGERQTFRYIMSYLAQYHPELIRKNMHLIPEYGRWDDMFVFVGTGLENDAFALIRTALHEQNGLAAKWCPRLKSSKKILAAKLCAYLGMTPKQYRQTLARLTKVVETPMCANQWEDINFSQVPSVAMKNYRKSFARHTPNEWEQYLAALEKGDPAVKINASAIFPHDIIKQWVAGSVGYYRVTSPDRQEIRAAEAQWNALPDYMGENSGKVLVMADVSGSMYSGLNPSLAPIQASVSLALYCAERCKGPFKNFYMSFSGNPEFVKVQGSNIYEKVININNKNVGYNTDINRAFAVLLSRAKQHSVSQADMQETLLILSDMQFDCSEISGKTNFETIRDQYRASGYQLPQIVFWNLNSKGGVPVKITDDGVALVSGFSPSILTAILGGEVSPMAVLNRAIHSGRYDAVTL